VGSSKYAYFKKVDKKVDMLNTTVDVLNMTVDMLNMTSKAEHEAIGDTIQTVRDSVDDINLSKSPIGTILSWVSKVQQNKQSIIKLPLGI
jgi:hypothetical protein